MDDDDEREFSRALVFEFLYQAKDTFEKIEGSLYVSRCPLDRSSAYLPIFPLSLALFFHIRCGIPRYGVSRPPRPSAGVRSCVWSPGPVRLYFMHISGAPLSIQSVTSPSSFN